MMAVGCDLNGVHYENGEAFQPSPLYKCTCIAGAIGCTPAFIQKPAGLLGPAPLMGNKPASTRTGQSPKKHQQDTNYMSGECFTSKPVETSQRLAWTANCCPKLSRWDGERAFHYWQSEVWKAVLNYLQN